MNTPNRPTPPAPPSAPAVPMKTEAQTEIVPTADATIKSSESVAKLATALAKAQGDFTNVEKDAKNPFFKSNYATLAAIISMIRKPLAENGISFVQTLVGSSGNRIMQTIIMHSSGEWIVSEMPCVCPSSKPQEVGSATTYAKRYGLQAAFGISVSDDTDDDGNLANGNK